MTIELGIAVRDITPPPGLPMGGYAARTEPARSTLDPLACRAAVFRCGNSLAALIALDLLYVREPWAADIRRVVARSLDTDPAAVMLAATHTHAGPAVFRSAMLETEELAGYEQWLAAAIKDAVSAARRALRPVLLSFGAARVEGVAANRQEEGRQLDDGVRVLTARTVDGHTAGVVVSFGCHPTVLPPANLAYSRDLFGAAVDAVEREISAPAVLFNGAAADVSTRFTRNGQSPEEVARLGCRLAAGIVEAIGNARPIADAAISARTLDVPLVPRRLPTAEDAQREVSAAAARVEAARGHVSAAELRRLAAQLEGAMAQLYFSRNGGADAILGSLPQYASTQAIQLGGCDILGVPGEMFSEVGREVCARRSRPALLVGYANDYVGYLVPREAPAGYESLMSFVTAESADAIAASLVDASEARR